MPPVPPHDLNAERSVLAALLQENDLLRDVAATLKADDFFVPAHQQIFEAMRRLSRERRTVNQSTLEQALRNEAAFAELGGRSYLDELADLDITARQVTADAETVREKAIRRRLVREAEQIAATALADATELDTLLDTAVERMLDVRSQRRTGTFTQLGFHVRRVFSTAEQLYEKRASLRGLSTGLSRLDELTLGLAPGSVTLIAGRHQSGKTSLALHLARHAVLEANVPVAFFPLSLSADAVTSRLLAAGAEIPHHRLRSGRLEDSEWPRLAREADRLFRAPLYLGEARTTSMVEVRSRCRQLKAESGALGLVVIDDLQLLPSRSCAEACAQLKEIARDLQVPVVATLELGSSASTRPTLQDLRAEGVSGREAELVLFAHRDAEHVADSRESVEIIVAKQENGPPGSVVVKFRPECLRIDDMK